MTPRSLALRFACVAGMALWVGGFTFYGGVVVPILHEELDRLQAGGITRRVTDALNVVGAVTVATWWLAALVEGPPGPAWARRARLGLLAATTMLLAGQVVLHAEMDFRLDAGAGGLRGFYPLHRAYLVISTAQWLVNLAILAASLVLWSAPGDNRPDPAPITPPRTRP